MQTKLVQITETFSVTGPSDITHYIDDLLAEGWEVQSIAGSHALQSYAPPTMAGPPFGTQYFTWLIVLTKAS